MAKRSPTKRGKYPDKPKHKAPPKNIGRSLMTGKRRPLTTKERKDVARAKAESEPAKTGSEFQKTAFQRQMRLKYGKPYKKSSKKR